MKRIALVYGGFSGESEVSKKSAAEIYSVIDSKRFEVILVRITDTNWIAEFQDSEFPIDKNDFSFQLQGEKITFHSVFNIIHGTPGEDGRLSAYFDLIGIQHNSHNVLQSALTFNKSWCNRFLSTHGIKVPTSVVFYKNENYDELLKKVQFPSFVKPNNGGSSIGTHKVFDSSQLLIAIKDAFIHDNEVIVEEFIEGREFSCGIVKTEKGTTVMPITEIIINAEFFDYKQKYSDNGATEITPANLTKTDTETCQHIVKSVFHLLRLNKIARIDFILKDDTFFLIEVNTIPGMSSKSILPQQAKHLGISFPTLVNDYLICHE